MTLLFSSCEERIEIDGRDFVPTLTVNALMNLDTIIFVNVSKTETLFPGNSDSVKDYPIDLLSVTVSINNGDYFSLSYDQKSGNYISEVIPKIGDVIKLEIIDTRGNYKSVTSETKVMKKPEFSIVRQYKQYSKKAKELQNYIGFLDTSVYIVCKIKDTPNEKNYYYFFLKHPPWPTLTRMDPHIYDRPIFLNYSSDNIIFSDNAITASLGGFPIGFSAVFDDSIFEGKEYEFIVIMQTPPYSSLDDIPRQEPLTPNGKNEIVKRYLYLNMVVISEQTYKYLKSLHYAKCSKSDIFSEPIYVFSNINNGNGIFGATTRNLQLVDVVQYKFSQPGPYYPEY